MPRDLALAYGSSLLPTPLSSSEGMGISGEMMRKQIVEYTSPLDALVAVTKRLSTYESQQQMDSEEFFDRYNRGKLSDDTMFVGRMITVIIWNFAKN